MDEQATNYHREFFSSPHHATLGLLTLGLGFMSAQLLGLILGVTVYVLGWIYLPDLPFFRRWVDRRNEAARRAAEAQKVAGFVQKRQALIASLSPERRERYAALAGVCRDIETAGADDLLASADPATDPRLRKLDELMWTCLRLLSIEQSLERFLETEQRENLPEVLKEAEAEAARLNAEIEALKAKGAGPLLETKQRLPGLAARTSRSLAQAAATNRTDDSESRTGGFRAGPSRLNRLSSSGRTPSPPRTPKR